MSNVPKFTVLKDEDDFVIEINSGKYKDVYYSYKNIDLVENDLSYDLEVFNDNGFINDKRFLNITKKIMMEILNKFMENRDTING